MGEVIEEGNLKIMFSAPHSADHLRKGKIKPKEINTDTLVKELYTLKDVNIIYKTESLTEDANWDKECIYKTKCKEVVQNKNINIFLDIHGMDYKREEDICIGTANGRNILGRIDLQSILVDTFQEYGYRKVTIDKPFNAKNSNCMSSYISRECNIPAFQIEINNKYRYEPCEECNLKKLIECFSKIIDRLIEA